MVIMLMINIFFILLCFKFLLLYAWWQLSGDTKSFSDQPSASLCTFVPSSEGYSNEWDTSCRLACFRQTCSVPVLHERTVATLGTQDITPCCPPSSCSTAVSSALQLAALPLFCSSYLLLLWVPTVDVSSIRSWCYYLVDFYAKYVAESCIIFILSF